MNLWVMLEFCAEYCVFIEYEKMSISRLWNYHMIPAYEVGAYFFMFVWKTQICNWLWLYLGHWITDGLWSSFFMHFYFFIAFLSEEGKQMLPSQKRSECKLRAVARLCGWQEAWGPPENRTCRQYGQLRWCPEPGWGDSRVAGLHLKQGGQVGEGAA